MDATHAAAPRPSTDDSCASCRYWFANGEGTWGSCRINPPQLFVLLPVPDNDRPKSWTDFPRTRRTEWCGAHARHV